MFDSYQKESLTRESNPSAKQTFIPSSWLIVNIVANTVQFWKKCHHLSTILKISFLLVKNISRLHSAKWTYLIELKYTCRDKNLRYSDPETAKFIYIKEHTQF